VFESFDVTNGKTAEACQILNRAGVTQKSLLVVDQPSDVLKRAMRNISHVRLADVHELNASHVMSARKILFTKPALAALDKRFPKGVS
jgi:ribosomal protein L4